MSFATDDLHTPPLLFHHMHRDLRMIQQQQQQHRSSGSYPSHDHHIQDPRQSPYSAHLALNSVMVPRQSPNHPDTGMPPDQHFMIPAHPQALDMQQQHPQSWGTVYDHNGTLAGGFHAGMPSLPSFPFTGNSYHSNHPPTSPPPTVNNTPNSGSMSSTGVGGVGGSQNGTGGQGGRMTLAGSLDPSTGIFYRTPEHPRLRTAQACEKCRTRKAKCSGEHPTCKRCQTRGLICEYAKEGRVRGPNKLKSKAAASLEDQQQQQRNYPSSRAHAADHGEMSQAMLNALREQDPKSLSTLLHRRNSLSLGEHRANRPRPPNLNLDTSRQFRLDAHAFHLDLDYQHSQHIHPTHTPGPVVNHYLPPTEEQHMIHTAPPTSQIPVNTVNYRAIPPHIQVGPISPSHGLSIEDMSYSYEENRSPSTSSNASMHGSATMNNQSMVHIQHTYALENGLGVDHNSAASSPSAYRTSGDMTSSPTMSALGIPPSGSGGGNTSFDGIHPIDASASLPLVDPAWVSDVNDKHDFATMQFSHDASADDHIPQDVLLHHQHHAAMAVQHDAGVYAMNAVGDDVVGNAQVRVVYPIDLQMR
ncbi:hypothetical protein M378DRAFT_10904 [Amanita muscaria Koide BX008]|uniref:Zn(2)-C6 fungal-type domain-containing protein n=1 Tax=Amanita muscaria (strain Koide BX008) TaxID=946122 RepID=A0A0C2WU29_AMAMK|nr:hypothetical protein M378DRAFT_10904 [Amanita muscaria Koide BX008]